MHKRWANRMTFGRNKWSKYNPKNKKLPLCLFPTSLINLCFIQIIDKDNHKTGLRTEPYGNQYNLSIG